MPWESNLRELLFLDIFFKKKKKKRKPLNNWTFWKLPDINLQEWSTNVLEADIVTCSLRRSSCNPFHLSIWRVRFHVTYEDHETLRLWGLRHLPKVTQLESWKTWFEPGLCGFEVYVCSTWTILGERIFPWLLRFRLWKPVFIATNPCWCSAYINISTWMLSNWCISNTDIKFWKNIFKDET